MFSLLRNRIALSSVSLTRSLATAVKRVVPKPTGPPKDEFIPHSLITIVDSISNTLLPPTSLTKFLSTLDRSKFSLLLVDPNHDPPICKVIDKKAEYAKAQAKKVASKSVTTSTEGVIKVKAQAGPPREIQLSWGVQPGDLTHKLAKARELLGKGNRVAIVISNKKGSEVMGKIGRAKVIANVITALEKEGKLVKNPTDKGENVIIDFKRIE